MTGEALYRLARDACERAHAPYSGLRVGAVLEDADGGHHLGANVEFSSYGLTVCAERAALVCAVLTGARSFRRLAVAEASGGPIAPCGACRQALSEFAPHLEVVFCGSGGLERRPLDELLPQAFRL